jgi:hypothetical protein
MAIHFKVVALSILAVLSTQIVFASQSTPPAPVPAQILTAKRVFISNGGEDRYSYDEPLFDGGPDRTYNQFYAAMKNLARYELVGTPAEADLFFEICFTTPVQYRGNEHGLLDSQFRQDPQFRLVIRDPRTNAILRGVTEHAEWAILQSNRNKNFDKAMSKLVSDVQVLTQPAPVMTGAVTKP